MADLTTRTVGSISQDSQIIHHWKFTFFTPHLCPWDHGTAVCKAVGPVSLSKPICCLLGCDPRVKKWEVPLSALAQGPGSIGLNFLLGDSREQELSQPFLTAQCQAHGKV